MSSSIISLSLIVWIQWYFSVIPTVSQYQEWRVLSTETAYSHKFQSIRGSSESKYFSLSKCNYDIPARIECTESIYTGYTDTVVLSQQYLYITNHLHFPQVFAHHWEASIIHQCRRNPSGTTRSSPGVKCHIHSVNDTQFVSSFPQFFPGFFIFSPNIVFFFIDTLNMFEKWEYHGSLSELIIIYILWS